MKKINKTTSPTVQKTLCVVAGGSGGHILPALELAKNWHAQHPDGSVVFFSSNRQLDQKIISQYPFISSVVTISFEKFTPLKIWLYPKLIMQGVGSLITSYKQLARLKPEKVISTGGLIAIPVVLAAWLYGSKGFTAQRPHDERISIELYELNVTPGKAIKFLAPFATTIFIIFKKTASFFKTLGKDFSYKCHLHTYPLRFTQQDLVDDRTMLLTTTCPLFDNTRKTIFILGGSQGSVLLNTVIKNFLRDNPHIHNQIQVIHQTGSHDKTDWQSLYSDYAIPAITFSYAHNIKDFYVLADLILCRAGAGTLFELLFFKKKSIVIPLVAKSTDHQVDNAHEMAQQYPDLFTVIEQKEIEHDSIILYKAMLSDLNKASLRY